MDITTNATFRIFASVSYVFVFEMNI